MEKQPPDNDNLTLTIQDGALFDFMPKFENFLKIKYNVLGQAIVEGNEAEFQIEALPQPENGVIDEDLLERVKIQNKLNREAQFKYNNDKISAFGDILKHLSYESRDRIECNDGYALAMQNNDPIKLWKIVKYEHSSNGGELAAQQMKKMVDLLSMKQGDDEDVELYSIRFHKQLRKCTSVGNNLNDAAQTHAYLASLNRKKNEIALSNIWNQDPAISTFQQAREYIIREDRNYKSSFGDNNQESHVIGMNKIISNTNNNDYIKKDSYSNDKTSNERIDRYSHKRPKKFCSHCFKTGKPRRVCESHDNHKCLSKSYGNNESFMNNNNDYQNNNRFQKRRKIDDNNNNDNIQQNSMFSHVSFMNQVRNHYDSNLKSYTYVLDTGATCSIYNNAANLYDIANTNKEVKTITNSYIANKIGNHKIFGEGLYLPEAPINLISYIELLKNFNISYDEKNDCFNIKSKRRHCEPLIAKRDKNSSLYLISATNRNNDHEFSGLNELAEDNKDVYFPKNSIDRVWMLHKILDHPYTPYLVKLVKGGALAKWNINIEDIHKANLNQCIGCLMGKMQGGVSSVSDTSENEIGTHQHADIVFVKTNIGIIPNLMSVEENTGYILNIQLKSKTSENIIEAVKTLKGWYSTYKIDVKVLHTDRESSIGKAEGELNKLGIRLVRVSAGTHEKQCERHVRTIRNRIRCTLFNLPYRLPSFLYQYLYKWVITSNNMMVNNKTGLISPQEIITEKTNDGSYLRAAFGSIAFFYDPNPKNGMAPRSSIGIVIARENESRAVSAYLLEKNTIVSRDKFYLYNANQDIINIINRIADNCNLIPFNEIITIEKEPMPVTPNLNPTEIIENHDDDINVGKNINRHNVTDQSNERGEIITDNNDGNNNLVNKKVQPNEYEIDTNISKSTLDGDRLDIMSSKRKRNEHDYKLLSKYGHRTYVSMIENDQTKIKDSIKEEIKQMIKYNVWDPVYSTTEAVIPSKIFTVIKYNPDGSYSKHKSRLVAGGHREFLPYGVDVSSPTVRTESLMIALNVASIKDMDIATLDIGAAFLEAKLSRQNVYVSLQQQVVEQLIELDSSYKKYVNERYQIIVKLKKALYGLKESSYEWYKLLISVLKKDELYSIKI